MKRQGFRVEFEPYTQNQSDTALVPEAKPEITFATWLAKPRSTSRVGAIPWFMVGQYVVPIVGICAFLKVCFLVGWHGFGAIGSLGTALFALGRYVSCWIAPKKLSALMDIPVTENQFPVAVTLRSGKNMIGRDLGVITFTDDILHFEGQSIVFDLPNRHLFYDEYNKGRHSTKLHSSGSSGPYNLNWIVWNRPDKDGEYVKGTVEILPFERVVGVQASFRRTFKAALINWSVHKAQPRIKVTLPPITPRQQRATE